ncbi:MAG: cytochrome c [Candidatus Thiothrix putei]|uniref:Cytochrome c n=1 Tax=Candidatus Thiothrix putei TaxID=3080811 RepID=A0AA95KI19_9GAMM|nr:MAG: cytochrome c [Candidatus Thiothrix putei]
MSTSVSAKTKDAIKAFIKSRPVDGIPGRRSMPQFNFTDAELDEIVEFLKYTSEINTENWPPNIQG